MSTSWTNLMWQADIAPPARKLVALAVADCHNASSGQCNPGVSYVAEKAGMSEGQVRRHLVDLCASGVFTRDRIRRADGSLSGYVYVLGPLWTSPDFACVDAHTTAHPRAQPARTHAPDQYAPMRGQEEPELEPEEEPRGERPALDFDSLRSGVARERRTRQKVTA